MARPARPLRPFSRAHIQARPILPHNPPVRKIFFVKYLHYLAVPGVWWDGPVYSARPRPDSGVSSSPSFLTGSIPAGGSVEKPGWRWAGDAPGWNGVSCPRAVAVYPHTRPPPYLLFPIRPPRSRRAGRRSPLVTGAASCKACAIGLRTSVRSLQSERCHLTGRSIQCSECEGEVNVLVAVACRNNDFLRFSERIRGRSQCFGRL